MKLVCYKHGGETHYRAVKERQVVDLSSRLGGAYPDIVAFIAGQGLLNRPGFVGGSNS